MSIFFIIFLGFRSTLFNLLTAFFTVIFGTAILLCALLPYSIIYRLAQTWCKIIIFLAKAICGIRYQVLGKEFLQQSPVIYMIQHQSAWETIFALGYLPPYLSFVFKRELLWVPFFGWAIALARMIPINRKSPEIARESLKSEGLKAVKNGKSIVLFPEGRRSPPGIVAPFKRGGSLLAVHSQTPLQIIALNSGFLWGRRSFIKRPGLITVQICKPLSQIGHDPESLLLLAQNQMETASLKLSLSNKG